MPLIRFLFSTTLTAVVTFFYASWARAESEAQIGRMQLAAYNTPGVDSPVPRQVFTVGMSVLGVLWFVMGRVLRMRLGQRILSLLAGVAGGVALLFVMSTEEGQG